MHMNPGECIREMLFKFWLYPLKHRGETESKKKVKKFLKKEKYAEMNGKMFPIMTI